MNNLDLTKNIVRKLNQTNSQFNQEQGSVLVELAIILPIIFVITLTIFEYTRAIQRLSIATSASKEFANIIKRDCPDTIISGAPNCMEAKRIEFKTYLDSIIPGIEIRAIYLKPGGTTALPTWTIVSGPAESVLTPASRFDRLIVGSTLNAGFSKMDRHQSIVFAECYVPFNPIIIFLNSIFNLPSFGGFLYDATII